MNITGERRKKKEKEGKKKKGKRRREFVEIRFKALHRQHIRTRKATRTPFSLFVSGLA
jgi:hypothetical protein